MPFYLSEKPGSFRGTFLRFTHSTTLIILCLTILINSFSSSPFVKAEEDQSCSVTDETTKNFFDLSPLKKTEGDDWIVTGYETSWTFHINICNNVLYKDDDRQNGFDDVGVYGISTKKGDKFELSSSLGRINDKPFIRGDKLIMNFTKGDMCGGENLEKSTYISFICDKSVEGYGQPAFVSTFENCGFFFEWRTPAACPTSKKSDSKGGWGVFFTIFIIALIVYFVGGIVYNRMVHNASGVYQIPNWEFWSNSCDFLKDMILIILAQCPIFKPRRRTGNYSNLPNDEENILIEDEFEEH